MALQPVDIVLCLKLSLETSQTSSFEGLEAATSISSSTLHRAAQRAQAAGLLRDKTVVREALLEFLKCGIRYAFYVKPGVETRGMPTASAAPPLAAILMPTQRPPVWSDPLGRVRGFAVTPLHEQVPEAARKDERLYELLALVDAVRLGGARERGLAVTELTGRLK